ncbi:ABC transporter permease subunit/CPBP intramembrane protease [Alienimonas sp. DA493]|uniref:ABC transporter permease subunit/CPBP intramembrane protease n=1 Tax=Alienimonas sp. DA493 TaxID=3373605 RepID=UPI003754DD58
MSAAPNPLPRIALKELRESLRDRRTTITLVLMPLLVYPLLGALFRNVLIATNPAEAGPVSVVFESEADAEVFQQVFQEGTALLERAGVLDRRQGLLELNLTMPRRPDDALEAVVARGEAELGLRVAEPAEADDPDGEPAPRYTILTRSGSPLSVETGRRIVARLRAVNEAAIEARLREAGLSAEVPADFATEAVEPTGGGAISLATVVPLILLLMTATGAVYPAIDTTAGERERGTLETLVAAPVSRLHVLLGKFVAVWAVAVLTAGANLIAMTATVYAVGLDRELFGENVPWWSLPATAGLLALTAGFFAAVLLAVTSAARSFKEAQAYLIPLMLCCLAPGGLALTPSIELDLAWAAAPLMNLVLLAREVLSGTAPPLPALVAVVSTVCYAGLALSVAARIFGTDAILYGGPGGWGEFLKPPSRPDGVPPLGAVLLGTLACVAAFLVLGGVPGKLAGLTDEESLAAVDLPTLLIANAAVSLLVFVGLPWAIARWAGGSTRRTFALRTPSVVGLLGGLLLGLGAWAGVFEILLALGAADRIGDAGRLAEFGERIETLPLPLVLACLAIVPAVTEEFAFRGFVLTRLKVLFGAVWAVIASGLIFGVFHVVKDLGLFDRLIGTTLLGLLLGWVRVRTGSLWPGMLLHAVSNAALLSIASYKQELSERFDVEVSETAHLPAEVLAAAAVSVLLGAGCVWFAGRKT